MKKRLFLALSVALVCVLLTYWLSSDLSKGYQPADLLPGSTLVFAELDSPADSLERIEQSRLGRRWQAIDWQQVMQELGYPPEQVAAASAQLKGIRSFLNSPLFDLFFSGRTAVALLSLPGDLPVSPGHLADNLVLVTKPRHSVSMLEIVGDFFSDRKFTRMKYRGNEIRQYLLGPDTTLFVSVANEMIVASYSLAGVRTCLDNARRQREKGTVLSEVPQYLKLRGEGQGRENLFVYAALQSLSDKLATLSEETSEPQAATWFRLLQASGLEHMVILDDQEGEVHHTKTIITVRDAGVPILHPFFREMKTGKERVLGPLPADILLSSWTNWFDVEAFWNYLLSGAGRRDRILAAKSSRWLEQKTGRSMAELLQMFGHEAMLFVSEIKTSGFFPVPSLSFCVETLDGKGVEQMLDKSFAEIPSKKEPFKGHTVTSLMVAGGLMQPSYVVLDRCLIVADSREQIEAILAPGENRLRRDRDFQKVDPDMFGPGNLALFARTAQLNDGLQQFVSWLGTLIAIRDYQAGAKSKVIIDKVVLPLLDGLKMYKAKGIRGYHRKDSLILESNVLIENS